MRYLTWILLPFCAAAFLAVYVVPNDWWMTAGFASLILSALSLFAQGRTRTKAVLTMVGLCLGFLWCGVYQMIWCAPARAYIGETRTVSACVTGYPQETAYGASVTVRIQPEEGRAFRACLYLSEGWEELTLGDQITVTAAFSTAEVIHDREVSYYTAKGIHVLGKKGKLEQVIRPERLPWTLYPQKLARWLQGNLDALYRGDSGGLLKALTTGEKDGMSYAFRSALSRTGLSHMTAVSGMHMVFLVEFVLLLPGNRRWKAMAAIPVMFGFALLTGMAPSVIRAAVMETLLLLAPLARRQYDPTTALSTALFLLLIQNPWAAGSVGLQLSFASVAGIHLLLPRMLPEWRERPGESRKKRWLRHQLWNGKQGVALTLSAMAFTVPLTVLYFDTISVISPVANLLVVWCVALLMGGGLLTGVLYGILPVAGVVLAWLVRLLSWYVVTVVKGLSLLPFAALNGSTPWIRFWLLSAYVLLALYCLKKPKGWRVLLPVAGTLGLLVFALAANRTATLSGTLTTGVLDVGQGQCVALLSGNEAIAVDCGGTQESGAGDELADYLNQLGVFRLNLLVLTHYDSDHTNGVAQLLERMPVDVMVGPDMEDGSGNRTELERLARQYDTEWECVDRDRAEPFGEAQAQIFAPVSGETENDASLSVLASARDFDVLVTGDMESQAEDTLVERKGISDVEVLVVAHHGSRYSTSTAFLEKIKPEVGVISVGEDNSYGHPTQDVLDRLEAAGVDIYRTDLNGTVTINEQ